MTTTRGSKVEVKCSCGKMFMARVADVKRGWGKYCSKSCKAIRQEKISGQYRAYLDRTVPDRDGYVATSDPRVRVNPDTGEELFATAHLFSNEE